ncbi:unnamed protein product [Parnassius mnemosyne]|uniref:PiggyBac transposable element-derived protein domain-containing protein n=1 Tax=Parnassius mnemosyne TaxID=213953 RepID=A0AAV1LCR4_9NEOP
MDEQQIEDMLRRLENGDISEDDLESDGEDIPYNPYLGALAAELEDDEDVLTGQDNSEDFLDQPLIQDEQLVQGAQSLERVEAQPTESLMNLRNLLWRKQSFLFDENNIKFGGSEELPSSLMELQSPYQFFTYFFTNPFMENIVTESARYAVQKQPDRPEIFTVGELRKYFGILIFMSVYHYPSTRSYWSNKFGFSPIKEAMPINKFEKMRKLLHFNNNDDHLPVDHVQHDRLHKLRPIITHLNEKFSSVTIEQRLSIDEQMCATKVGHFLKQYLPNKPQKWGFKLFVLCNLSGFAYRFIIYSGKEANEGSSNSQNLGVVGQTVMNLLSVVPRQRNHIVYFDNYYTSLPLMCILAKQGIHSLGTIQRNRLGKTCKLPTKQDVMKSSIPRGSYEEYVTNFEGIDMTTVSWKDNKQVVLASTYVGACPVGNIERFDKKEKKRILITCPKLIREYNMHMGGVDLMDSFLGRNRIRMKSRKWYMRIFYHLLDLTVINSWVLYKKVEEKKGNHKKIMTLADFRSELAETLCKYSPANNRGRPSTSAIREDQPPLKMRKGKPCQVLPPLEVRFDQMDHNIMRTETRGRCMMPSCNLLSIIKCSKCNVHLCSKKSKDCFTHFHNSSTL